MKTKIKAKTEFAPILHLSFLFFMGVFVVGGFIPAFAAKPSEQGLDTYQIDKAHSHVLFKTKHNSYSSWGRFTDFSGKFALNEKDMSQSSLEITIKAKSINTDEKKRDRHLRGPDFFHVRKYPEITFKSKKVKSLGGNKYEVEGELGMHGVFKSVKMTIERFHTGMDSRKSYRTGGDARFKILRSEFGMRYGLSSVADEVEIIASIEAVLK